MGKNAEWEAKRAEWEAKQEKRAERKSKAVGKEFDVQSTADSEVSTSAGSVVAVDEKEVESKAMMDKEVRKLTKHLREIVKLEGRSYLDTLQKEKVAKKKQVELDLDGAMGLAKV